MVATILQIPGSVVIRRLRLRAAVVAVRNANGTSPLNWLKVSALHSGGHNEAACGPNDLAGDPGGFV